jgi:hypothetical protein
MPCTAWASVSPCSWRGSFSEAATRPARPSSILRMRRLRATIGTIATGSVARLPAMIQGAARSGESTSERMTRPMRVKKIWLTDSAVRSATTLAAARMGVAPASVRKRAPTSSPVTGKRPSRLPTASRTQRA